MRNMLPIIVSLFVATATAAESPAADAWLMMVSTNSTDPLREADFNAWYDDIDIPDVLEVPGYERARRGLRLGDDGTPATASPGTDGRYVALYDIDSGDIDKTIIEMLMATRRMEARGRSTNLLEVTERVYFRRRAPLLPGRRSVSAGTKEFLLVERVDCCEGEEASQAFVDWYDREHVAGALRELGVVSAARYELYRVLMIEPRESPRYLTLFEIHAESDQAARATADRVLEGLRGAARLRGTFVERGSALYSKLVDVRREPATSR